MTDPVTSTTIVLTIVGLAIGTMCIRLSGVALGSRLPQTGPWARGLKALPGCLIISLVAVMLMQNGPNEWIAGGIAFLTASLTRSLPITMIVGIAAIFVLRSLALFP